MTCLGRGCRFTEPRSCVIENRAKVLDAAYVTRKSTRGPTTQHDEKRHVGGVKETSIVSSSHFHTWGPETARVEFEENRETTFRGRL